jgi:large subunit ribosomal protein L9
MKIILLADIKGLGKKYEVKTVKDGYARHFLIPKGLAKFADQKSLEQLEFQKAVLEKENQKIISDLEKIAENLKNHSLHFILKTGPNNAVFGSITKDDIKKSLLTFLPAQYHNLLEIILEKPIKKLGEHIIPFILKKSIQGNIKIIVEGK